MTVRANFQNGYGWRYLMLAGGFLFAALFFAYDGFIGYPQKKVYAERYDELAELDPTERQQAWRQITDENNWPKAAPRKSADEIAEDIRGQYFYGLISLLIAIPPLVLFLRTRGSWIEATPTGLRTSWGQQVDFSQVSKLDKKKWSSKGIAIATYEEGSIPRRFVFDDFKYERQPLGQMLRDLESLLPPDKIVGGPVEAAPTGAAPTGAAPTDAASTEAADHAPKHDSA